MSFLDENKDHTVWRFLLAFTGRVETGLITGGAQPNPAGMLPVPGLANALPFRIGQTHSVAG